MNAGRFEQFVADVWRARGWTARVTQDGSDRGVDVIATKTQPFNQKEVIQAKRYSADNPVGSPQIQQYASLRQQENADTVVVVTSGRFSKQAEKLARQLNVKMIDGNSLYNLVKSEGLDAVVSEYLATDDSGAETNSTGFATTESQSSETPVSTEADQPSRRTRRTAFIAGGIIGVVALLAVGGALIALSAPGQPEAGSVAEGSPTPTRTPVPTAQSSSTETSTPTATPSPTPTPTASVSEICPTIPDTTAQSVRPTLMMINHDWETIKSTESDSISGINEGVESRYLKSYLTPDEKFVSLEIYKWESEAAAQKQADSLYTDNPKFQAWIVQDGYSFAVQVYGQGDDGEAVLLNEEAVEPAKLILSNIDAMRIYKGDKWGNLGMRCVNRTVNLNT